MKIFLFPLTAALLLLVTIFQTNYEWWPSFASLEDVTPDTQHYHLKHHNNHASAPQFEFRLPQAAMDENEAEEITADLHPALQLRSRKLASKSTKSNSRFRTRSSSSGKGSKSSKSSSKGTGSSSSLCSSSSSSCDEDSNTPTSTPAATDAGATPTPTTRAPRTLPPNEDPGVIDPTEVEHDTFQCIDERPLTTGAVLTVELDLRNVSGIVPPPVVARAEDNTTQNDIGFHWTSPANSGGNRRRLQQQEIGTVTLTEGGNATRFAHFTYAVDHSDSTDANCGKPNEETSDSKDTTDETVLDCLREAVVNLNSIVASSNVAVNVGLVAWHENATRRILDGGYFVDASANGIELSLNELNPQGGTSLFRAIQASIESVKDAVDGNSNIVAPAIIVITDGKEGTDYNDQSDIDTLNELGASVYMFAVGKDSECTSNTSMTRLPEQTGGGSCNYVANPADVELEVERVVTSERKLESVTVQVDGVRQASVSTNPTIDGGDGLFANETPVTVSAELQFNNTRRGRNLEPVEDVGFNSTTTNSSSSSSSAFRTVTSEGTPLNENQQRVCMEAASRGDVARCCVDVTPTTTT